MTTLSITVTRGPGHASGEQRQLRSGTLTIGRGVQCDWVLPDPQRSLSRTHCRLAPMGQGWQVCDLSTNGTFVNAESDAIGSARAHVLRDGDRLRLGDYELEVRLQQAQAGFADPLANPFDAPAGNLFGSPTHSPSGPLFGQSAPPPDLFGGAAPAVGFAGVRLPGLDDPVPSFGQRSRAQQAPAMPDHSPAASDAFVPPAVTSGSPAASVPDDWFHSLLVGKPGNLSKSPPPSSSAAPAPPREVPAGMAFEQRQAPDAPPPQPKTQAVPQAPAAAGPAAGALLPADADAGLAALALVMQAAGLPPDTIHRAAADPQASLRQTGAVLLEAVSGMRALLVARGLVKREFRIEQTMLRPKENNPLKFAASDEQALASLLDPRSNGVQAVREAVGDLTEHEVAVLAATQAAARSMLEGLSPALMEAEDDGGGLLPGATEKRLWLAYKRRHAKLLEQLEDDFESAFGRAFARAYEQAVRSGGKP